MTDFKITEIKRKTLNQTVYETIKYSITNGDLPSGTRLFEVHLAKQLNVSPTPVREAFRLLSAEGLVKISPWKGAVVQNFTDKETLEIIQCRAALECLAFKLNFKNKNENDINIFENIIEKSKKADFKEFIELSISIHNIWLEGCENSKLLYLMSILKDVVTNDKNILSYNEERKQQIINEHTEILNELKNNKIDNAINALKNHIYNGYYYTKKAVKP